MAFRQISRELYDNLLRGYREMPGNFANAARAAGCRYPMAKRGWELGWSPRIPWARPIKTVLREEQEAARAEQRRLELLEKDKSAEERDRARQDSVKAMAQEGQMLAAGRANVLSTLASATQALPAVKKLLSDLNAALVDPNAVKLTPMAAVKLFREFGLGVRYLVEASNRLIEAERTSKGEPSRIIGLEVDGTLSLEDAQREIEEVSALYELAQQRGLVGKIVANGQEENEGNGKVH
jgi:hypothetical protein